MMKKHFVPYELANLAKEKGFDDFCFGMYFTDGTLEYDGEKYILPTKQPNHPGDIWIAAPLHQQIIDWFREKHNIFIETHYLGGLTDKTSWFEPIIYSNNSDGRENGDEQYKYYDCLNKVIEEAFKLI